MGLELAVQNMEALLWNIMYDGLLRLRVPRAVTMVAFVDDVALVIVSKLVDEA